MKIKASPWGGGGGTRPWWGHGVWTLGGGGKGFLSAQTATGPQNSACKTHPTALGYLATQKPPNPGILLCFPSNYVQILSKPGKFFKFPHILPSTTMNNGYLKCKVRASCRAQTCTHSSRSGSGKFPGSLLFAATCYTEDVEGGGGILEPWSLDPCAPSIDTFSSWSSAIFFDREWISSASEDSSRSLKRGITPLIQMS